MRVFTRPARILALLSLAFACGGGDALTDPTEQDVPNGPAPSPVVLANPNATQVAVVGQAFSYDASRNNSAFVDPAGGVLSYSITMNGVPGLSASGAVLSGAAIAPGVHEIVVRATDSRGNSADDTFHLVVFAAGLTTPALPPSTFGYSDASAPLPAHFLSPGGAGGSVIAADNTPIGNPTTDAGATLGRVLFYDVRLSGNDAVSCASCHVQSAGFADTARFSAGINGQRTPRHSMPLGNVRFYQRGRFFWDERALSLEAQALEPIADPTEMGLPLPSAVEKLRVVPYYAALFTAAFGTADVTTERIARALAQFMRSMVTSGSKHDAAFAVPGPPNFAGALTGQELLGLQLFLGPAGCARCHTTEAHIGIDAMNNGLDAQVVDAGAGDGRFKTPSLRNVGVRTHFMHDGRFTSLEQVVQHYENGVQNSPNLDSRLRLPNGQAQRLMLSANQRAALVAYLHALTDPTFLSNVRFSDPFPR